MLAPLALTLALLPGLFGAGHAFAQSAPPAAAPAAPAPAPPPAEDPSGLATGDKTTVQDAGGNAFVPAAPADSDDAKTKADKNKALNDYNAEAAKEPLAVKLADGVGHVKVATNMAWVLNTGYLVLFMQAGFALLTTGLVRKKNAGHLMMLNFAAYVIAFIGYYIVGFALMYGAVAVNGAGPSGLGGTPTLSQALLGSGTHIYLGKTGLFLMGKAYDAGVFGLMMFEVVFMETAGYIIVGAICERITFWAFILCELFIGAILYPVFGCWVWGGGWMSQLGVSHGMGHGYVDFAGSTVVHGVGGFAAMALAVILGPRIGKYTSKGKPVAFPGHNLVFVVTGTFILLFGWMGFNPGSTLQATDLRISVIAVNTNLAAVFGSAAALVFWTIKFKKPDVSMACNGMLAGLVAITAPCAFVNPICACIIGILAGLLVCVGVLFNERVIHVDDPCGAISVHGYCGYLGGICVGLFADGRYGAGWNNVGATEYLHKAGLGVTGIFFGDSKQFLMQIIGATIMAAWAFGATFVVFKLVNAIKPIRVSAEAELAGLDIPEFGALAYPEDEYPSSGVEHEQAMHGHGLLTAEQSAV
jgi:Amt family ammonium transporter